VKATVGEDFTGAIADSINYAVEQLRDLVSAITSVTHEVTASTEASMQTVESLSESSKRQTESINSVHASIREIGDGITKVNENAQKTLDVANNSVETAMGGAEVVKDTITGMDTIRDQIQDTAKRIKRLGESSQEIGGFVSLINDIAEHTNTLSLNAAIQAAMAGDAGKGFAVVADEVHELAERSADATRQIESLVKVIQGDIKEAVQSMEQTTSEVVSGTRLAQRAGAALDDIQRVSKELQELVDSINEASSNQTKAASEIKGSMDVIQAMTSNTTSGIEATSGFMNNLGALTERLQNAVSGFSLDAGKKNKWTNLKDDKTSGTGKTASGSGLKMTDKDNKKAGGGGLSGSASAARA
jgi:twitching motility protein PilJ